MYITINIHYFVACDPNCDKCDTNGATNCDADGCRSGFHFKTDTMKCEGECYSNIFIPIWRESPSYRFDVFYRELVE